jgi:hypothetical protein
MNTTRREKEVTEMIINLNRDCRGRNWFVCYNCNWLVQTSGIDCPTDKRGENQIFCKDCCVKCETCECLYAIGYEYEHRKVNECWSGDQ